MIREGSRAGDGWVDEINEAHCGHQLKCRRTSGPEPRLIIRAAVRGALVVPAMVRRVVVAIEVEVVLPPALREVAVFVFVPDIPPVPATPPISSLSPTAIFEVRLFPLFVFRCHCVGRAHTVADLVSGSGARDRLASERANMSGEC